MEREIVQTITIPDGIKIDLIDNHTLNLTNDKGNLTRKFKSHMLKLKVKGQDITLEGAPVNKKTRALLMTVVAHIKNMVEGLLFGYKYNLKLVYSHFPMTAKVEGNQFVLTNFIGEKCPRKSKIVGATKVEVKGESVTVSGIDIEQVSQTASNIEQKAKVKGKDIRRYIDGIYLAGKETLHEKPENFAIKITRGKIEEIPEAKTEKKADENTTRPVVAEKE